MDLGREKLPQPLDPLLPGSRQLSLFVPNFVLLFSDGLRAVFSCHKVGLLA